MRGEWAVFRDYLSAQQCEDILRAAVDLPSKDATIGLNGAVITKTRRSSVKFVQRSNAKFRWLFDSLWDAARQANNDFFGFDLNHLGYMQIAEYKAENAGEYKRHQDVFWINKTTGHRKLSCVVQLTDPAEYEGGQLELYDTAHPLPDVSKRGTVVFFPSFVYHAALPVTKGTRQSLAAWFEGPKWR
jgi:PKHD-type hydroxylase